MAKKIGELYWEITAQTGKFEQGLTNSKSRMAQFCSGVNDVVQGLTGFNLSTVSAVAGVVAVGNAVKQGIQEWQNYALSSRDAAAAVGASVEDFTRLVQVGDDARLSQESLTTALKMMAKNGLEPSIANLADLADELKGMDTVERAARLSEVFGRNWSEVYKILKDGGQALRDNTAAVADGLVVTKQAADEAEAYYQSIDKLNESVEQLKNKGLKGLIPILTFYANTINNSDKYQQQFNEKLGIAADTLRVLFPLYAIGAQKINDTNEKEKELASSLAQANAQIMLMQTYGPGAADAISGLQPAADGAAGSIEKLNPKMETLRAQSEKIAGAYRDMNTAQDDLEEATKSFGESVAGNVASQLENAGIKGDELKQALGILDEKFGTSMLPTQQLKEMVNELAASYDPKKPDEFKQKIEEMRAPMEDLYQPIVDARVALQDMRGELEKLTGRIWKIAIEMGAPIPSVSGPGGGGNYGTYTPPNTTPSSGGGSYYDPLTGTVKKYADGGSYVIPGGYNENWPVGPGHYASSGETVTITPEGQPANSVTINIYGITDPKKVAEQVATELRRARRN